MHQCETSKSMAMAFYHTNGLTSAFRLASAYAGEAGRVATLPDIIDFRLANDTDSPAWSNYFTTTSQEFYGLYRGKVPMVAVLHGVGPLSTIDGILQAYAWHYESLDRSRRGGRVSQQEFNDIVDGKYGPAELVEWETYLSGHGAINQHASSEDLINDSWFLARIGGRDRAERYLKLHDQHSQAMGEKRPGQWRASSPPLVAVLNYESDTPYVDYSLSEFPGLESDRVRYVPMVAKLQEEQQAYAHLLSLGSLSVLCSRGPHDDLVFDIGCHGWNDGARLLAMTGSSAEGTIHPGFSMQKAISNCPDDISLAHDGVDHMPALMMIGQKAYTQRPKEGCAMDSGAPMCRASNLTPIGDPVAILTETENRFFLRYSKDIVEKVRPEGANAYLLVDHSPDGSEIVVQFYAAHIDWSRRLFTEEEILANSDLTLELVERLAA